MRMMPTHPSLTDPLIKVDPLKPLGRMEPYERLLSGCRNGFHYLAIRFESVLPFVACTAFNPEYDLDGVHLQRLACGNARFEHVVLNITACEGRTVAVFGWIAEPGGPGRAVAASYDRVPDPSPAIAASMADFA